MVQAPRTRLPVTTTRFLLLAWFSFFLKRDICDTSKLVLGRYKAVAVPHAWNG